MKNTYFCPKCMQEIEFAEKIELKSVKMGKRKIRYNGKTAYCSICNEQILTDDIIDYNIEQAHKKYKEKTGKDTIVTIISYYNNSETECGCKININTLNFFRNKENYFFEVVDNLNHKGKIRLLYELAQIDYKTIRDYEEGFVISMLKSNHLELQEYALNTLKIWENISDKKQNKRCRD